MSEVSIRELRHKGGEVIDRAERGEKIVVTRDGRAVAELTAMPRRPLSGRELIARRRHLQPIDLERLRQDLDTVMDSEL